MVPILNVQRRGASILENYSSDQDERIVANMKHLIKSYKSNNSIYEQLDTENERE